MSTLHKAAEIAVGSIMLEPIAHNAKVWGWLIAHLLLLAI